MEQKDLKIGLALGGGGAKGMAHLGILQVFEKNNLKISSIVGTSAGAIIGSAYSLGLSTDEILKRCEAVYKKNILRLSNFNLFGESFIKSDDLIKVVKSLVDDKNFEDTKIPFAAVAVDLESGKEVLLEKGKILPAVCASSSIPGVFPPYFLDEKYLVDGGVLNNVPVNCIRAKNDIVIGIDLGDMLSKQHISGIIFDLYYKNPGQVEKSYFQKLKSNPTRVLNILLRSLDILREETQSYRYNLAKPDLIIKPELNHVSLFDFAHAKEVIEAGKTAAEKAMPKILDILKSKL